MIFNILYIYESFLRYKGITVRVFLGRAKDFVRGEGNYLTRSLFPPKNQAKKGCKNFNIKKGGIGKKGERGLNDEKGRKEREKMNLPLFCSLNTYSRGREVTYIYILLHEASDWKISPSSLEICQTQFMNGANVPSDLVQYDKSGLTDPYF